MELGRDASLTDLIDLYLTDTPSRNRGLDMLPIFAHLDADRVTAKIGTDTAVTARPTFHFRLPDCRIGNPDWSLSTEWDRWRLVEQIAAQDDLLDALGAAYIKAHQGITLLRSDWAKECGKLLGGLGGGVMNRPVIGVTTSKRSGWRIFPLVALNVWLAGGRAVRWGVGRAAEVAAVDGIIIGGGDDISPDLYGGKLIASARLDPERDALEIDLVRAAQVQSKPVLGICRGSQMLNIALGGTLNQDAYVTYTSSERIWTVLPRKTVCIEPGTRLAGVSGECQ